MGDPLHPEHSSWNTDFTSLSRQMDLETVILSRCNNTKVQKLDSWLSPILLFDHNQEKMPNDLEVRYGGNF